MFLTFIPANQIVKLFGLILIFIIIRLNVGLYLHDEFLEKDLFIKHRLSWKWKFYSPIGMSDQKLQDLTPEKQYEQLMFNEFVKNKGLNRLLSKSSRQKQSRSLKLLHHHFSLYHFPCLQGKQTYVNAASHIR